MRISAWSSDVCSSDLDQPLRPAQRVVADRLDRARAEWYRAGGIGHVFVVGSARGGYGEAEPVPRFQIQRAALRAAAVGAGERPAIQPLPLVAAGLVGGDGGNIRLRRARLQVPNGKAA